MRCACRVVAVAFGGCRGQVILCDRRCHGIKYIENSRQVPHLSCWEKTQIPGKEGEDHGSE